MKRTLFVVVLAACGSKSPSTTTTTPVGEHEDEHASMPPEVARFHEVLSPRWHAAAGPDRMKDTCAAVPDLQSGADRIKATVPAGAEAAKWTTGTKQLVDAVAALKITCDPPDATAFELAFKQVHESFHVVSEAGGSKDHAAPAEHDHAH